MSVSINVGIFTDAAGNTNANASNMTFKLTSKRRTVHISTNVTDATSSYIPVWIRTEVPVWPDISESDIDVLHARMSKFRRINSTTYSFLLQPPSKYSNHSGMACTGRNELGRNEPVSLVWCEEQCNLKSDCVSFEYYEAARRCQLSTSCTEEHMGGFTGWLLYIKLSTVQPASKPLTVNLNTDKIHTDNVASKCNDTNATFYIENIYGSTKYDCLRRKGTSLVGSHYTDVNEYDGRVEYVLKTTHENLTREFWSNFTYDMARTYCENRGGRLCDTTELTEYGVSGFHGDRVSDCSWMDGMLSI